MPRKGDEQRAPLTVLERIAALDSDDDTQATRRRRWPEALVAVLVVVVLVAVGLAALLVTPKVQLSASSTARGTGASSLLNGTSSGDRSVAWSSIGQAAGTTLTMTWSRPTTVNRIAWRAPARSTIQSAMASFSDGSTLMLTTDSTGDVGVHFPARTVREAVITVTAVRGSAATVGLASLAIDRQGSAPVTTGGDAAASAQPRASSSMSGGSAKGLVDGAARLSTGALGAGWSSAPGDDRPWVELRWPTPQTLTSVQLYGPSRSANGPTRGDLRFSDGSQLTVGAVRGDTGMPTTIGFAPRVVKSVRFQMEQADVGLKEFAAFDTGSTPPEQVKRAGADLELIDAATCNGVTAPNTASSALRLLCPSVGDAVRGRAEVVVSAPPSRGYAVSTWVPLPGATDQGAVQTVAQGTASKTGLARFTLDTARLPQGPITLDVRADSIERPLAVQFVNLGGVSASEAAHPVPGRTLLYSDDFSGPLSITRSGATSAYAATKPTIKGPAEFGGAMFENPEWKTGNIGTIPGGYLRMRLSPADGRADPFGYDRTQIGAMLSSAAVGGGGTSAQYGYFEARMLGAPGLGTWPAFWMLSNSTLVDSKAPSGEVDAVELYGTDTKSSCHSVHSYTSKQSTVRCIKPAQLGDWSLQWHTYGVGITPDGTDFFIDGHLATHESGPTNADDAYFFLLNLASGGGWPVDLRPTGGVSDMYVDWVRVYS
ncbi:family 16 glycosylhydrolase [uncultured Amnibacterium sp.]|uniref:glycoside hydrolase family 16 protein n=1 Tax=uncultured Amnibacterium sp. TaxID=1631851 RepID=UPI0035CB5E54